MTDPLPTWHAAYIIKSHSPDYNAGEVRLYSEKTEESEPAFKSTLMDDETPLADMIGLGEITGEVGDLKGELNKRLDMLGY